MINKRRQALPDTKTVFRQRLIFFYMTRSRQDRQAFSASMIAGSSLSTTSFSS